MKPFAYTRSGKILLDLESMLQMNAAFFCDTVSSYIASSHVHTCDSSIKTNVVVIDIHTCKICCLSLNMDVHTWSHDLGEVHNIHVRDSIHHLQAHHMRIQHGKYCFRNYPWQGNALCFGVKCPKR